MFLLLLLLFLLLLLKYILWCTIKINVENVLVQNILFLNFCFYVYFFSVPSLVSSVCSFVAFLVSFLAPLESCYRTDPVSEVGHISIDGGWWWWAAFGGIRWGSDKLPCGADLARQRAATVSLAGAGFVLLAGADVVVPDWGGEVIAAPRHCVHVHVSLLEKSAKCNLSPFRADFFFMTHKNILFFIYDPEMQ